MAFLYCFIGEAGLPAIVRERSTGNRSEEGKERESLSSEQEPEHEKAGTRRAHISRKKEVPSDTFVKMRQKRIQPHQIQIHRYSNI